MHQMISDVFIVFSSDSMWLRSRQEAEVHLGCSLSLCWRLGTSSLTSSPCKKKRSRRPRSCGLEALNGCQHCGGRSGAWSAVGKCWQVIDSNCSTVMYCTRLLDDERWWVIESGWILYDSVWFRFHLVLLSSMWKIYENMITYVGAECD
jgi:hypothetical protein